MTFCIILESGIYGLPWIYKNEPADQFISATHRMTYTDLYEIIEKAQKGSGYTRAKTTQAKTVLDSLAQKGWRQSYIQKNFQNLDDELLSGWPSELFQEYYMKERATVLDTLEQSLLKLGIKPSKVRETLYVMAPLENTCYTNKQLLEKAIEYVLGWYKPITTPDASYFYKPDTTAIWIPHEKKEIMNMTYSCTYTIIPRFERKVASLFPESEGKVFFHTTNWKGAINIMNVINRNAGRTCLDFGYYPSFYVSETVQDAIDWGFKNARAWHNEVAIMAFHVPMDFQKDFHFKDLRQNKEEWKWVVTTSRDCKELSEMIEYEERYDFIYGPMLANPPYYATEGPRMHRPPTLQLAAKTNTASRFLYKCMKGAFVFKKSNTPV